MAAPNPSPIGQSLESAVDERLASSAEYRRIRAELAAFERLARVVIARRAELGLTQRELAERMQTTPSVISRIESGQHTTSIKTLQRLAEALEASAVVGLRFAADTETQHDALIEL
jgi:ribosome-binding protein aMBF1 (putative translation factor)